MTDSLRNRLKESFSGQTNQNKKMLIIDDSSFCRRHFKTLFEDEFDILEANDGEQGLAIIKQYSELISVVILDVEMPKLNGIELLRKLSQIGLGNKIPVIVATSNDAYQLEALKLGAWDFVSKTSPNEIIISRVKNIVFRDSYNKTEKRRLELGKSIQKILYSQDIVNNITSGVAVFKCVGEKLSPVYISDSLSRMLKTNLEILNRELDGDFFNIVHPDDLSKLRQSILNVRQSQTKALKGFLTNEIKLGELNEKIRLRINKEAYIWVSFSANICIKDRSVLLYTVLADIDKQKKAEDELAIKEAMVEAATEHADLFYWEYYPGKHFCINGDRNVKVLGLPRYMYDYPESLFNSGIIHPDDIEGYRELFRKIDRGAPYAELTLRESIGGDGEETRYIWKKTCFTSIYDKDGKVSKAFATTRNINDYKDLEKRFSIVCRQSGIGVWSYDLETGETTLDVDDQSSGAMFKLLKNQRLNRIDSALLLEEDKKRLDKFVEGMKSGKKSDQCIIRIVDKESKVPSWARIIYTIVYDAKKKPKTALGSIIDVTQEQYAKEKYSKEMELREEEFRNEFYSIYRLNLTKNSVDSYFSNNGDRNINSVTELVLLSSQKIPKDDRKRFADFFDRKHLIEEYYNGNRTEALEYKIILDGKAFSHQTTINLMEDVSEGDIVAFVYTRDTSASATAKAVYNSVLRTNYDYIALLDKNEDTITSYNLWRETEEINFIKVENASSIMESYFRENCYGELEAVIKENSLETVDESLKKYGKYKTSYAIKDKDGSIRRKIHNYYYIDKESGLISVSCQDVTDIYESDIRKKQALEIALKAAEQASLAKSDFLARMSHEIRTPMNAIIGMTAIAREILDDKPQLMDCISKIDTSSQFLLSLINDILDMSKIESGKVLLKNIKFSLEELINSINAISYNQCESKGVRYICVVGEEIDSFYVGDRMKLQQILINIISNAIKFTDSGGSVKLDIGLVYKKNKISRLRFVIEDTGCGISEDFLPHIFSAFSQEHSGATTNYGGTGLGLSICKNLVSLMQGKIDVSSQLGKGTKFTIDLPFENCIDEESESVDLSSLSLMVYHTEEIFRLHRQTIAKELGLKPRCASNIEECVAQIKALARENSPCDAVLLDNYKEVRGSEIAERIKQIPEIKNGSIPCPRFIITEYVWDEEKAKILNKNIDYAMQKPIFKMDLQRILENILCEKDGKLPCKKAEEREIKQDKEFDFSGLTALIVEDHPLNTEVAKRLLEIKGFKTEEAENGKVAVERFKNSKPWHYDCILMDIRMPIMDGFEATKEIRKLEREDAQAIPIIAMTANAFDDDIEASLSAGMNGHIAKPVNPKTLYETLAKILDK